MKPDADQGLYLQDSLDMGGSRTTMSVIQPEATFQPRKALMFCIRV